MAIMGQQGGGLAVMEQFCVLIVVVVTKKPHSYTDKTGET